MKLCPLVILYALAILPAPAQPSFASGSTGADGALNITGTSGTVITFDPKSFNPPLNPAGDNIFNFTTINIQQGVTLRLSGRNLTGPIYWLASGAVTIAGTIDLTGEAGLASSTADQNLTPAYPGAGGFAGGVGGRTSSPAFAAQAGSGPGGGAAGTVTVGGQNGTFTGNTFLVPLIGGSGGGGQLVNGATFGAGAGAGGGAILIASSTSISITGSILATGGSSSCSAGAGAGGAIRLMAPVVSGNGSLTATAYCGASQGRVRIETGNYQCSCFLNGPYTVTSTPNLYLPTVQPGSLRVASIGGVSVPASPTGSFSVPDTVINTGSPVSIVVQASQIPVGTTVTLEFFSESTGSFTATTSALAGSTASSTASASVTFPPGFTRGYALASW